MKEYPHVLRRQHGYRYKTSPEFLYQIIMFSSLAPEDFIMTRTALLTILFGLVASISGSPFWNWPWGSPAEPTGAFRDLAVTLPDPTRIFTAGYWFNSLPKTQKEAEQKQWTNPQGLSCSDSTKYYVGTRFIPPKEPSIGVLYDSQGTAAGFQVIYDVESLTKGSAHSDCKTLNKHVNNYNFRQPMINTEVIDGKQKYVLTAYFYDPKEICSSTIDPTTVKNGFGTALYFQNGPTPDTLMVAPTTRPEAIAQNWDNNKCLPLNGYHNFLNSSQWDAQNCTENVPNWLFYDENEKLSGFGFSVPGCDPSPRFQHPPGAIVKYVSGSQCAEEVADSVKFSNINVYLVPVKDTLNDCKKGALDSIQKNLKDAVTNFCSKTFSAKVICNNMGLSSA